MNEFVQVEIPQFFNGQVFKSRILRWRDETLESSGEILERESQLSVRSRFYRTGVALGSLDDVTTEEGQRKSYEQFSELFYFRFGEYGTGRRGSASGVPHPNDYRYGQKPGMSARFMLGNALRLAEPQIVHKFQQGASDLPKIIKG
jgi:hypothetical protein